MQDTVRTVLWTLAVLLFVTKANRQCTERRQDGIPMPTFAGFVADRPAWDLYY